MSDTFDQVVFNKNVQENKPCLYIVIPCYNEANVLPITSALFLSELNLLISDGLVSDNSKILFVNDGSSDNTWDLIKDLSIQNDKYLGISLSRNRGHQNAVLAGMMEAKEKCDITITIDCDGQDDISVMHEMVIKYLEGNEIVYGVRNNRKTDTLFKRYTAELFYKIMNLMGCGIIFNHADYRLISSLVLDELENFHEVNLFLRGMVPLVGFKSEKVYYKRNIRLAGESHYNLSKMLSLSIDGITSLTVTPLRLISVLGLMVGFLGLTGIIWALFRMLVGDIITGWTSTICVLCLLSGVQLISLGVIGTYIGKIYLESKHRPRFIISERSWVKNKRIYKTKSSK